jgi:hypothetical protein
MARDCHDYYGSSATPRRQQRTMRLRRAPKGSAGTAGTLPTFTHMPVGRVGAQLYPGGIATRYRNTARGLDRPNRKRSAETIPKSNRDRAPHTAHSRQFRDCPCVSGLLTLIRLLRLSALLPHPARWRSAAARSSGAAPALRRTSGIRLPLSFTRPLRRPKARPLTPPAHMAPRGAVPLAREAVGFSGVVGRTVWRELPLLRRSDGIGQASRAPQSKQRHDQRIGATSCRGRG